MNNIHHTSTDSSPVTPKRGILRTLVLALATASLAGTAAAQLPADATGYLVELHTWDFSNAGTNSVIKMSLDVRDPDWGLRTLGSWTLDHSDSNDHERNKWDTNFFPESTATAHIEKLHLVSDGKGSNPGWAWDELHVTRIERGLATWTWTWEPETWVKVTNTTGFWDSFSGWIYGGKIHSFDFTSASPPRSVPYFLKTPSGLKQEYSGAANKGSILVTQSIVTPEFTSSQAGPTGLGGFGIGGFGGIGGAYGYSGPVVVPDQLYRIGATNHTKSVRCLQTSLGNGNKSNTFTTLFDNLSPGVHVIETLNPLTRTVIASTTVEVRARLISPVTLR